MAKRNKKQARKLRNLVMLCSLCAVVLTVSTYAWFIGMKTVNVTSFDIDIATTEGLFLSMDGVNWSYKLDAANATPYSGHTNTWAKEGLIPVSTVGDMDPKTSRMMLYEKASLTTSPGGYRLLTSRVGNYTTTSDDGAFTQGKGYVAFDLFIKNLSGAEYYETKNIDNEEDIYLTTDSVVKVANGGVADTGIENSVRVAFAQVGRVKADTTNASNITGITCKDKAAGTNQVKVTGICREAQIWEPNDKAHVDNAISWYDTACFTRKANGDTITATESFELGTPKVHCGKVENGTAYPTYAISRTLNIEDNVDVYDGAEYNGYTKNTSKNYKAYLAASDKSSYKLVSFPYFTDSDKILTKTDRPTFMKLAPNSITKVRVYVFIEGQDIDNYDFASLGKKISINFGFTKERFTGEDINYSGPPIVTEGDDSAIASPSVEN